MAVSVGFCNGDSFKDTFLNWCDVELNTAMWEVSSSISEGLRGVK
jgi:hypothetical protein